MSARTRYRAADLALKGALDASVAATRASMAALTVARSPGTGPAELEAYIAAQELSLRAQERTWTALRDYRTAVAAVLESPANIARAILH